MITRKFNCTQQELFAACSIGWDLCTRHIEMFTAFKPKYNAAYIAEQRASIAAAMAEPGSSRRSAALELKLQELRKQNQLCVESCLKLKRHMDEVWKGEELQGMLKKAGIDDTREMRRHQFEVTQQTMVSAALFLSANKTLLTANLNMAEDFDTSFTARKEAFQTIYHNYLDSLNNSTAHSREVLERLNDIYSNMSAMFADARVIFRQTPEVQKRFSFELVLSNVRSSGWAGIRGSLTLGGMPYKELIDLEMRIPETGEIITPDEEGRYQFDQLKAGFYTIEVKAAGYQNYNLTGIEVKKSTYTQLNLDLKPETDSDQPVLPPQPPADDLTQPDGDGQDV
jgi:hypothetical protein